MFYLETGNNGDCCGCRACEHICPTKCINMIADEEGFNYPIKNEEICIHCDLCRKACPSVNKSIIDNSAGIQFSPKAYLAIHKNEEIVNKCASGGVFPGIVESFCLDEFIVFGVEFDKNLNAVHSYADTIIGTEKYRKSKYIQSDINNSYKSAEKFLKKGKRVLFTGTPCQIAGLRLYLRKDYENLFCADIVCHGVPSQKVFDEYKRYLEKKYKDKVTSFSFRHKTVSNHAGWSSKNIKIGFNDKNVILPFDQDYYLRGFHRYLFYRPSCYECKFANPDRVSDITMADFWGVEKLYPEENVHKGVSVFLANTVKGQALVNRMADLMRIEEVNLQFVIESNGQLNHPAKLHPQREQFFDLLKISSFDVAVKQCIPNSSIARRIAHRLLSKKSKDFIKKLIR